MTQETLELLPILGDWVSPGEIDCDAVQNLLTKIENELNNSNSTSPNVTKKSLEHWPKTVCKKWNNDQSPELAPLEAIKGCLNADQSNDIMPPHGKMYEKLMTTYLDQWNDEVSIEKLIRHLPNPKQTMKPYLTQHRLWALQIWHHEALLHLTCILKQLKLQNDNTDLMICLDGKNLEALNAWTSMDENITRSRKRQSYQEICRQEKICHPNDLEIGMKCLQELIPSTYRDVQEVLENFASLYEESTWVKAVSFIFKVALPSYIMLWISFWTLGNDFITNQQYSQAQEWFCGNESSIVEKNECRKWSWLFLLSYVNFVVLSVVYLHYFVLSSVYFVKVLWDVFRTNKCASTLKITKMSQVSFLLLNRVIAFIPASTGINGSNWYFSVTLPVKFIMWADFMSSHFRFWMNPSYAAEKCAKKFQKLYILWTLYEVCVYGVVQLCLRLWLVSSETEMNGSFIHGFVGVVSSIFSFEESEKHIFSFKETEVQFGPKQLHVIRIVLACVSLVFSLGGLQQRMKNNCVGIINLSFFYLSLLCQILARVIVILTFVRSFPESDGCQIGSFGAFLLINCLCGIGVQILNLHFNHELPTKFFDWCLLFLSGLCSSLVLVHVPLAKLDSPAKKTPKTPTFDMYFFYLVTAIVSNFGSVLLNQSTSNWSVWEPFGLVVVAAVCQIIYYKGFGHPWKELNGQEPIKIFLTCSRKITQTCAKKIHKFFFLDREGPVKRA